LCNNAFDAMREKVNKHEDFNPELTVKTFSSNGNVTIEIEDNGPGIPDHMRDKIMQPFFTTKKGTQGTGLGLSITNDIIKAHGGELKIQTEIGNGSVIVISLPTKKPPL
ncbi:MAG TPA: HAMP domain-containing sensor histidine kinase, partial [Balneolaceae bacterium]|nr:HAMP domain-containing sensor histidine kinase [Balneolaceae bacterium]